MHRDIGSRDRLELGFQAFLARVDHDLRLFAENDPLDDNEAVQIGGIDVFRVDLVDFSVGKENHFVDGLWLLHDATGSGKINYTRPASLHVLDHRVGEPGSRHQGGPGNQFLHVFFHALSAVGGAEVAGRDAGPDPGQVVGQILVGNRPGDPLENQVGGLDPAEVAQHHFGGQQDGAGVDPVLAGVLGCGAVGRLEYRDRVRHVGTRRDADAPDLSRQCIRNVVAVEVQGGDDVVVGRLQKYLLQEIVCDDVLDHDGVPVVRVLDRPPRSVADHFSPEFLCHQFVAPAAERPLGVLHDVALVHQGDRGAVVVNRVADGLADQSGRTFLGHRFDADPGTLRKPDAVDRHLLLQERDQFLHLGRAVGPFDAGVDVFGVFPEHDHVGRVGDLQGCRRAGEEADRSNAGVQVHFLANGDVE